MKVLISADMEGATGVTWPGDVLPGTPQWERCRSTFTSDVNAAVLGFYDGGADEVLINEAHWSMRNLLLEQLDERAEMLTGRHKSLSMVEGVQHGDVDGIAFVGYHARRMHAVHEALAEAVRATGATLVVRPHPNELARVGYATEAYDAAYLDWLRGLGLTEEGASVLKRMRVHGLNLRFHPITGSYLAQVKEQFERKGTEISVGTKRPAEFCGECASCPYSTYDCEIMAKRQVVRKHFAKGN